MRYRGTTKTKRKHHLIDGLESAIRVLEGWPEITAINPGVIATCRHNDHLKLTVQRRDRTGIRCLARAHGAVQELFLISSLPEALEVRLNGYFKDEE